VGDEERARIDRLLRRFSEAAERTAALMSEAQRFAVRIGELREALGNPFFYSGGNYDRPENADESIANFTGYKSHEPALRLMRDLKEADFTGYKSHEPALRLMRDLKEADRELNDLREQLHELGVTVE
jgi:hypothetical protein